MRNKYIFCIIVANVLWAFIPIPVSSLFNDVSIFLVVFLRFFVTGLIFFGLAVGFVLLYNKYSSKSPISLETLFKFTIHKNNNFFSLRNIGYFATLGFFGIILQLITYFLALKLTTISLAMIGFSISVIVLVLYQHGVKAEKLDVFKALYIIILVVSIIVIVLVKLEETQISGVEINYGGIFFVVSFGLCLTFFQIAVKKDSYSRIEVEELNKNKIYKLPRLFMKLSLTLLLGVALMFPFTLLILLIPVQTEVTQEIVQFFTQFPEVGLIFLRWEVLFLVFGATVVPYFLVFWASVKWSSYNLTFSQWNSILTIIEPAGGILFGVLIVREYFPLGYLLIVLFLLLTSIIFRYVHETTNKINAYLLISRKRKIMKDLPLKLLKLNGVISVDSLIGKYDLLVNVRTNSITHFRYLVNEDLRKIGDVSEIKIFFIDKIHKLNI
jgi:drug/metabolite transporter (DMT)-like permease